MWKVIYFTRANEWQPAAQWRAEQSKDIKSNIDVKIAKLEEYGLELLNTKMLDKISGDADLYELRNVGKGWRIATYFDRNINTFVLLHGWKKQKQTQPQDIQQARHYLQEYLSMRKGKIS